MQRGSRSLGSARVSRASERVLVIANFLASGPRLRAMKIKKSLFGAPPKPTRETRALPQIARQLDLHDLGFLVLEVIIDRFNEAIGELLHFVLCIAKAVFGQFARGL